MYYQVTVSHEEDTGKRVRKIYENYLMQVESVEEATTLAHQRVIKNHYGYEIERVGKSRVVEVIYPPSSNLEKSESEED